MRAKVVKRLRRQAYGKGSHPGPVNYFRDRKTGALLADRQRQIYQLLKRGYNA